MRPGTTSNGYSPLLPPIDPVVILNLHEFPFGTVFGGEIMKRFIALVPTDFSEASKSALVHAINLVKGFDGELHLLNVVENPTSTLSLLPFDYINEMEEHGMDEMNAMLKSLDVDLPPTTKIVRSGIPSKTAAETILEYAMDLEVDVIVLGTHGRRGARRLLMGSVTEEVVRRAMCPVLTVRQHKNAYSLQAIKNILVPIDFSEASEKILAVAEKIAHGTGASLTVMHVVDVEFFPSYGLAWDTAPFIERNLIDSSISKLNELVLALRSRGLKASWETDTGHAARVISEYAERNKIDLIVLGTHGRSGFDRLMVGSVAEKVLRSAPCPTMVVNTAAVQKEKQKDWLAIPATA